MVSDQVAAFVEDKNIRIASLSIGGSDDATLILIC